MDGGMQRDSQLRAWRLWRRAKDLHREASGKVGIENWVGEVLTEIREGGATGKNSTDPETDLHPTTPEVEADSIQGMIASPD